ncbi:MAG TPA: ATP-binding protein [Anaerolineaceae bacterium]
MTDQTPLTPEILVPRLGDYLVEIGVISQSDLQQALAAQEELRQEGRALPLGQIMVIMGMIDRETLDRAITEQALHFRAALQETNRQLLENNRLLEIRVMERTAELRQALEKLSEINRLKSNIVANISHELRTPLTHLQGYIELLNNGDLGSLTPDQSHAVRTMQRASDRLKHLIEDLILFSLSEKEQIFLQIQATNVNSFCSDVIGRIQPKARSLNINLVANVPASLPPVEADESKISWVVLQLLDNALKFSKPGSTVTFTAQALEKGVQISVADTGIGIPADRIEEIFEPFHQLDGSPTRRYGGTGLGLALARNIIEAHGSRLQVESTEGVGSTFQFTLKYYPVIGSNQAG